MQGSRTAADMIIDLETEKTSREIRIAKTLPAGPEENSRHTAGGQVGIRKTPNSGGKCKFQERNLQGAQRGFQELFCSFGRTRVKPGGSAIPNMNSDGSYKYLGINVKACGKHKMELLRTHLIPKILYGTTHAEVSHTEMTDLDKVIRRAVRGWLKLPKDFPNSMIHAGIRFGGLGSSRLSGGTEDYRGYASVLLKSMSERTVGLLDDEWL